MISGGTIRDMEITHSADDTANIYMGTTLIRGRLFHQWFDGALLPVLTGGAGDGDGDGGDGDGDGDDDGDGGDDDDDEDDHNLTDEAKAKRAAKKAKKDDDDDDDDQSKMSPSARRAFRQAAKYRVANKALAGKLEEANTALTAANAKLAKYEKDGAGDPELKKANETLTKERDDARAEVKTLKAKDISHGINKQMEEAVEEYTLDIKPKMLRALLDSEDLLTVDDEGEVEDLARSIRKLLKSGDIKKKAARGSDGDDDGGASSGGSSGSPMTRGGRNTKSTKTATADLIKKYPALAR